MASAFPDSAESARGASPRRHSARLVVQRRRAPRSPAASARPRRAVPPPMILASDVGAYKPADAHFEALALCATEPERVPRPAAAARRPEPVPRSRARGPPRHPQRVDRPPCATARAPGHCVDLHARAAGGDLSVDGRLRRRLRRRSLTSPTARSWTSPTARPHVRTGPRCLGNRVSDHLMPMDSSRNWLVTMSSAVRPSFGGLSLRRVDRRSPVSMSVFDPVEVELAHHAVGAVGDEAVVLHRLHAEARRCPRCSSSRSSRRTRSPRRG